MSIVNIQAASRRYYGSRLLEVFAKLKPHCGDIMVGQLDALGQYPLAVNGARDHVHVFFELTPNVAVADVLEKVKANSSKWINDQQLVPRKFEWQRGYGGFTYSRSQRNQVIQYIMAQEDHHHTKTFKEEYFEMLEKFEIEFEEKYVFEFYDE